MKAKARITVTFRCAGPLGITLNARLPPPTLRSATRTHGRAVTALVKSTEVSIAVSRPGWLRAAGRRRRGGRPACLWSASAWPDVDGARLAGRLLGRPLSGRRQEVGDRRDGGRYQAVVRPDAALIALEQAGLGEDPKVMTHGRLGETERCGQVTHGGFALWSGLDQTEQPQAGRVGECLEHSGEPVGIGTLDRLAGQRRDDGHGSVGSSHVFHDCTKTVNGSAERTAVPQWRRKGLAHHAVPRTGSRISRPHIPRQFECRQPRAWRPG